jgi:hypothetical protein
MAASLSNEGMNSVQFLKSMISKLKILENTNDIINVSVMSINYQTSFVGSVNSQAQVMIEAYRDQSETLEGLMLQTMT